MKKLLFLLLLLFSFSVANAQLWRYLNDKGGGGKNVQKQDGSYRIITLEGKSCKIRVVRKTLADGVIRIKCATDSLAVRDTKGIDTVILLNKNLLQVIYNAGGGSNIGYRHMLILCVNNGKFNVAMGATCWGEFGGIGPEGFYDLRVKLDDQNGLTNARLLVDVHDVDSSAYKGTKPHDTKSQFELRYNKSKNIFYNGEEAIDAVVDIWDDKINKETKRYIKGKYPIIKLDDYVYYFIDGLWYSGNKDTADGKYYFVPFCERLKVKT